MAPWVEIFDVPENLRRGGIVALVGMLIGIGIAWPTSDAHGGKWSSPYLYNHVSGIEAAAALVAALAGGALVGAMVAWALMKKLGVSPRSIGAEEPPP